jgi:hypothetical protein
MVQLAAANDLVVSVRLLDEPSLWCWEITVGDTGRLVETSWSSEWMAYDSADEALTAGRRRLAELAGDRQRVCGRRTRLDTARINEAAAGRARR